MNGNYQKIIDSIRKNIAESLSSITTFNSYISSHSDFSKLIQEGVIDPTCFIDLESNFKTIVNYMKIQANQINRQSAQLNQLARVLIMTLSDSDIQKMIMELQIQNINVSGDSIIDMARSNSITAEEYAVFIPALMHLMEG